MGSHTKYAIGNVRSTSTPRLMKSPAPFENEVEDLKQKMGRIWHFIETTDIDMADASDRIKEHRERQERLEVAAADAQDYPLPPVYA